MPVTTATPETVALRQLISAHRDEFIALLARYGATNPRLFGSVARGTADADSDIDILVEMDPADGNLLMRASGLMEETRAPARYAGSASTAPLRLQLKAPQPFGKHRIGVVDH